MHFHQKSLNHSAAAAAGGKITRTSDLDGKQDCKLRKVQQKHFYCTRCEQTNPEIEKWLLLHDGQILAAINLWHINLLHMRGGLKFEAKCWTRTSIVTFKEMTTKNRQMREFSGNSKSSLFLLLLLGLRDKCQI